MSIETDAFESALSLSGTYKDPSESHGILCGLICTLGQINCDIWFKCLCEPEPAQAASQHDDLSSVSSLLDTEAFPIFKEILDQTLRQFYEGSFSLTILLADEDESLDKRIESLASWCEGFILGLAVGGHQGDSAKSEEVNEFLSDIIAISATENVAEPTEEDEKAYFELVEYIKVGALLCFEELNCQLEHQSGDQLIH